MIERVERLDALRLPEAEQLRILKRLDESGCSVRSDLRSNPRYRYQIREGLGLQIEGKAVQFVVRPRNLSVGGISVLHGGFLYPGTACVITLRAVDGEQVRAAGMVVRCRCVHGRAHEVNIHFDEPIEIDDFVDSGRARPALASAPPTQSGAAAYPGSRVARLARCLGELADERAPLEQLTHLMQQLTALLGGR